MRTATNHGETDAPRAHDRRSWRPRSTSETVALALLGVVVIGAPELLGGVMPWGTWLTAGAALLALLAAWHATRKSLTVQAPPLLLVMCALWVWTVVQALPLPCALVTALAPESAASYSTASKLLGLAAPAFCALSRDPGSSQQEIVKGVAIVSTFLAAWMLSARHRRATVIALIAWSSLVMSCVALVHGALRLESVFGLYEPTEVKLDFVLAPLLNLNNLGGFALLGVPIWLGLARVERRAPLRVLAYVAVGLGTVTVCLSMSRGAISALLGALVFLALVQRGRKHARGRRNRWQRRLRSLTAVTAVAFGLGVGVYTLAERWSDVADDDLSKVSLIGSAFELALRNPWIGVGRGAFSSMFPSLHGGTVRFVYPESFIAQWATEWGLPATLLLLAAIAHALTRSLRRAISLERFGVTVGLLALCAQNLVDLSFELVGVAVVVAAALAAVVAPSARSNASATPTLRIGVHAGGLALAVALSGLVALAMLGPKLAAQDASALELKLRAALNTRNAIGFRNTLKQAVLLHPSDPTFAVLGAAGGMALGDEKAGQFISRAIARAPGWATPRIQAFTWLWQAGRPDSALVELRVAAGIDPNMTAETMCQLARSDSALVMQAAPHGPTRNAVLESAATCVPLEHPTAEFLDKVLVREFESPQARERRAWRFHRQGKLDESLAELAPVLRRDPKRASALMVRARILLESGRLPEAARSARQAVALVDDVERRSLLAIEARALGALGDEKGLQSALDSLQGLAGTDPEQLAQRYLLEADIARANRRLGHAFRALSQAFELNDDPATLRQMAELADSLGHRNEAARLFDRLCRLGSPDTVGMCAKRDALRSPGGP